MSELCLSSTPRKTPTQFFTLLLSDLLLFSSFILSHPLYFSYFIFFSPYLLKLLSFLSPLFITTSLLLLGFLTENSHVKSSESELGFFLSKYYIVIERFKSKTKNEDMEFHQFEELEAYKIIFDTTPIYGRENPDEVPVLTSKEDSEEKTVEIDWVEKRLEGFLKVLDEFEHMNFNVEKEKVELLSNEVEVKKEVPLVRSGSEALVGKTRDEMVKVGTDNGSEYTSNKSMESPSSRTFEANLGSYGSMRKEKEWKRTLACKLFEERHNVDGGGEGMDSLWETYEKDSSKKKGNTKTKKKNNKSDFEYFVDDDDCEEDGTDGQLCCLQALKFSSGKMSFGMRNPNLAKISKAIKGIGWLHRVTKHSKKG